MEQSLLVKPTKHINEPYYDYNEIIHYIEKLHNIEVRDCGGMFNKLVNTIVNEKDKGEYFDFWHWVLEQYSYIEDGIEIAFEIKQHMNDEKTPYWVKNVLDLIHKEYPEDTLNLYISW